MPPLDMAPSPDLDLLVARGNRRLSIEMKCTEQ
jgi:hypothetical protein